MNENHQYQAFDFMAYGKLIRLPLNKFLAKLRLQIHISTEETVVIEYFPATSLSEESESVDTPAWVGCLSVGGDKEPTLVAGCYNGEFQLIDHDVIGKKKSVITTVVGHEDPIRSILCWQSENDKLLKVATASKDQTIKLWSIDKKNKASLLSTISDTHISSVEVLYLFKGNDNSNKIISGDWSGNICLWDIDSLMTNNNNDNKDEEIMKSNKKRKGINSSNINSIETKIKPIFVMKSHSQSISGICMNSIINETNQIFTSSWDHSIKCWDLDRQDCILSFVGSKVITSIDCNSSISNTSSIIATSHTDGKIRLWDSRKKEEVLSFGSLGKTTNWISQVIFIIYLLLLYLYIIIIIFLNTIYYAH